jgi:mono/diheme cytochrome c family protein
MIPRMLQNFRTSVRYPVACLAMVAGAITARTVIAEPAQTAARWTIPATAAEENNPLPVNAATLAGGKRFYVSKCERCHGPEGKGNGPDADANYAADMDLTNGARPPTILSERRDQKSTRTHLSVRPR